ncbi:MAG: hypothetical protein ABID61_01115 [Candidatus Micrarchaeota archaeon]
MRLLIVFLIIMGLCMAFTVKPTYIAIKNTGNDNLDSVKVDLTVDCETKQLIVKVDSINDQPISGASTYVFYTNYGYQLIGTGTTNSNGISIMDIVGNMNYLTSLFIFRVDAPGHKSQEIEFTYGKCFDAPPPEPPTPMNNTPPPVPDPPIPMNNTPPIPDPPVQNTSLNQTPPTLEPTPAPICPIGVLLLSLAVLIQVKK